jgi:hypothetical protein
MQCRLKGLGNMEGCDGSTGKGWYGIFLYGLGGKDDATGGKAGVMGSERAKEKRVHAVSRTREAVIPSDEGAGNVCKTCMHMSSSGKACCLSRQAWLQDKTEGG